MLIVRTAILGVLVCTAFATSARADQLTMTSNGNPWRYYLTDQEGFRSTRNWDYLANVSRVLNRAPSPPSFPAARTVSDPVSAPIVAAPTPTPVVAASPPGAIHPLIGNQPILASSSSASVSAPMMTQSASAPATNAASTPTYDAYINVNSSNLPEASNLTVGSAAPWYTSPSVQKAFGGTTPTPDQQSQFLQDVKSDVEKTFALAGMSPKVTLDPSAHANHTISIASGLSYGPNANAVGITNVGQNGFGFIDKLSYSTDSQSLERAVAHNVSHELMHAFGISNHPDQTGTYIDSASATWDLLTNPNTTFSPAATAALTNPSSSDLGVYNANSSSSAEVLKINGDMEIIATPEPATLAAWGLVLTGAFLRRRRNLRVAA